MLSVGVDARVARRSVQSALCLNSALAKRFVAGLAECLDESEETLRAALRPLRRSGGHATGGSRRDSLCRVLLSAGALQKEVARLLIDKLPEYLDDTGGVAEEGIPRMILSCFRWLEVVTESEAITDLLLDVLADAGEHPELVREIVAVLPEVATDADHRKVYDRLKSVVDDDATLLAPVLDVLSNLQLAEEDMAEAVAEFQDRLESARAQDLPMLLRFLMQNVSADRAQDLVSAVRAKLRFAVSGDPLAAQPDRKGKRKLGTDDGGSTEALVLDALAHALRFRPHVTAAFLRAIQNCRRAGAEGDGDSGADEGDSDESQGAGAARPPETATGGAAKSHVVLDVWLLVVLVASGGPTAKQALTALRRDVARGRRPLELADAAILKRFSALSSYFQALLSAAGDLCRGGDANAARLGSRVYANAFRAFGDSYSRRAVLGKLVGHAGSGEGVEASAALGALQELATTDAAALLSHVSFVESMLDYLDNFGEAGVAQLYDTFARLSAHARRSGGRSQDDQADAELMIVLRKQLSHLEPRFQRMGVIGVTAVAARLAEKPTDYITEADDPMGEGGEGAEDAFRTAIDLLNQASERCERTPATRAFLYERLSAMLLAEGSHIDGRLSEWVADDLLKTFEDKYLGDLGASGEPLNVHEQPLQRAAWHDHALWLTLDGRVAPVYVDLMCQGLRAEERQLNLHGGTMLPMPAALRLMASNTCIRDGDLTSVDALLGAPLLLPSPMAISAAASGSASPAEGAAVATSLGWALSWMRELVAAFAPYAVDLKFRDHSASASVAAKVICRSFGILQVEGILATILVRYPSSARALAESTMLHLKPKKSAAGRSKGKGKGKKAKDDADGLTQGATLTATAQQTPAVTLDEASSLSNLEEAVTSIRSPLPLAAADTLMLIDAVMRQTPVTTAGGDTAGPAMLTSPVAKGYTPVLPIVALLLTDLVAKVSEALASRSAKGPRAATAATTAAATIGAGTSSGEPAGAATAGCPPVAVVSRMLSVLHSSVRVSLDASRAALQAEIETGNIECPQDADTDVGLTERRAERMRTGLEPHSDANAAGVVMTAALQMTLAALRARNAVGAMPEKELMASRMGSFAVPCLKVAVRRALGGAADWSNAFKYVESLLEAAMAAGLTAAVAAVDLMAELEEVVATKIKKKSTASLRKRVSSAAQRVLEHDWAKAAEDAAQHRGLDSLPPAAAAAYGAKGCRGATLARLVRLQVRYAASPSEAVRALADGVLAKVGSKGAGGGRSKSADTVEGQPALCGATLTTWINACRDEALAALNRAVREGTAALVKNREDYDAASMALGAMRDNALAVSSLIMLAKRYDTNAGVLTQSARSAGKMLEAIMRARPFLDKYMRDDEEISRTVSQEIFQKKEITKATRLVQQLCADAKVSAAPAVRKVVPATKKTLERYVFFVKAMIHRHRDNFTEDVSLSVANLKHKSLLGAEVLSQVVPPGFGDLSDEEGEDEYEDEDELEEEEEEEEG